MKHLLAGLTVLLLVAGAAWLGRGAIVASRLESKLASLGYRCDELELTVEGDLSSATLAPFSCTSDERAIARFALEGPTHIELEALRACRLHLPSARIELRGTPATVEAEGESFAGGAHVQDMFVRLLRAFDVERWAHLERLEIDAVEVAGAEGSVRATAENIRVTPAHDEEPDDAIQVDAENLRVPVPVPGVIIHFENLSAHVNPSEAHIEGTVGGSARLGRFEVHREWQFRADVDGFNTERPRVRFARVEDE